MRGDHAPHLFRPTCWRPLSGAMPQDTPDPETVAGKRLPLGFSRAYWGPLTLPRARGGRWFGRDQTRPAKVKVLTSNAHVAELADALDSGSFTPSWYHVETLGNKGPCVDTPKPESDLFGPFWPCFYAWSMQKSIQRHHWNESSGSAGAPGYLLCVYLYTTSPRMNLPR